MSFHKKTIHDVDIWGKRVLVRVDYNVPLDGHNITDDYRIKKSLPTIQLLLEKHCRIILCSHLGRPDGKVDKQFSLSPVARRLQELLNHPVRFVPDCVGQEVEEVVGTMNEQDIVLLENLRFYPEEEANDDGFATRLATLGEVFVQDAFGVVHRAHASTDAITHHLPAVAGLLLEKEVDTITNVMEDPGRPLMAIVGGAKISDKIDILNRFMDIADVVVAGGAMANTFLAAANVKVGKSLVELDQVETARQIIEKAKQKSNQQQFVFYIPQDGVVADKIDKSARTRIVDWDAHVIASIENYPKKPSRSDTHVQAEDMILDIGPFSGSFIAGVMQLVDTVIWNGAMGVTETPSLDGPVGPFAHGTETIMEAMLGEFGRKPYSVVGGGDTVGYIEARGMVDYFGHVSTGGGASMELMSGKALPGVEALQNKD